MIAGAFMHRCQSLPPGLPAQQETETDTITVYDTVPYIEPAPVRTRQAGFKEITVPGAYIESGLEKAPDMRNDTTGLTCGGVKKADYDSVTLQLPITQNVYEGKDYKAYVSGVYPSLDSLFVYPRREIVTIKKPPKRWHIGPAVGFGYTPHGFEPFIGVCINYSLYDF